MVARRFASLRNQPTSTGPRRPTARSPGGRPERPSTVVLPPPAPPDETTEAQALAVPEPELPEAAEGAPRDPLPAWLGSPFKKLGVVLEPNVFNPTAVVRDGKVHLLFRAEWNGRSRIGLAISEDGVHFARRPTPLIDPTEPFELPGGIEDPRLVEIAGRYFLTYTAYDGRTARLALATSSDLAHWTKHGVIFKDLPWSKSGAIVPQRIGEEYVMYFGHRELFVATSKLGSRWTRQPEPVLRTRGGFFDAELTEPGPPAWIDEEGIHLLYHGDAPRRGSSIGEVVFAIDDPRRIVRRSTTPLFEASEAYEQSPQLGSVISATGLVRHKGKILLYYGVADGKIAAASADEASPKLHLGSLGKNHRKLV